MFKKVQFFLKYHFLCYKKFPLEEIELRVNCYISIFNVHYQNTKSTTVLCIFNILEERPKALLKIP